MYKKDTSHIASFFITNQLVSKRNLLVCFICISMKVSGQISFIICMICLLTRLSQCWLRLKKNPPFTPCPRWPCDCVIDYQFANSAPPYSSFYKHRHSWTNQTTLQVVQNERQWLTQSCPIVTNWRSPGQYCYYDSYCCCQHRLKASPPPFLLPLSPPLFPPSLSSHLRPKSSPPPMSRQKLFVYAFVPGK